MKELPSLSVASAALVHAPIGIVIMDKGGSIIWVNRTLEKLLALSGEKLLGITSDKTEPAWATLIFHPETLHHVEAAANRPAMWLQTWRAGLEDGTGTIHYYLDVTEQHHAAEARDRLLKELEQHVTRDPVTGLPNRLALLQGLEPLVSRSRRYHNPLSVIRLRVERLADINSTHGSGSDDLVRTAIAQTLKDQTRWADLIGRFSDDEFLLVLPETNLESANHLMEKLNNRLAGLTPAGKDGRPVSFSLRFGVACWRLGDDRDKLLRRALSQLEEGI